MSQFTLCLALLATAGPAAAPAASQADPANPYRVEGVEGVVTATPPTKPGEKSVWDAVVVRSALGLYASPDDEQPIATLAPEDRLSYGTVVFVMKFQEGTRNAYLVGRYAPKQSGRRFERFLGWARGEELLFVDSALTVEKARGDLEAAISKGDPRSGRIKTWLPLSADLRYRKVPLRAITDKDLGTHVFHDPVPASRQAEAIVKGKGILVDPLAPYYVVKVEVADRESVQCLLSQRGYLPVSDTTSAKVYRENILGWIDLSLLMFWTSREAFEINHDPAAVLARAGAPLTLLGSLEQAVGWASLFGAVPAPAGAKTEVKPLYVEASGDSWVKAHPWPARWMRPLVLEKFTIGGEPGKPGEVRAYRLGILGGTSGEVVQLTTKEDFEKNLEYVRKTVENAHILELCIVFDGTASMEPVIEAAKRAVSEFVSRLQEEESRQPELTSLTVRVSVVVYTDHPEQFPDPKNAPPLVRDSGRYFEVKKKEDMDAFRAYLSSIQCHGNRTAEEEFFEGVVHAGKFIRPGAGSLHEPGATSLILLLGNSGSAVKGPEHPSTRLTIDDVRKSLAPKQYDGGRVEKGARVMVFPVFCSVSRRFSAEDRPLWNDQTGALVEASAGRAGEIEFLDPEQLKAAPAKLLTQIGSAVELAREQLRREIDALKGKKIFAKGKPASANAPVLRELDFDVDSQLGFERLVEVLGGNREKARRIVEQRESTYFAQVFAVDRLPSDGQIPRMRLCVLLNTEEMSRVANACKDIATSYEALIDDPEGIVHKAEGPSAGDDEPSPYQRLLVRVIAGVMGSITDANHVRDLERLSLREVYEKVDALPVVFGVLEGEAPVNDEQARDLIQKLRTSADRLGEILYRNPQRLFAFGVSASRDKYAWVYESELP